MTTQCPFCNHIYKSPNDGGPHYCELCGFDPKWKQEIAQEDEKTREIDHPALRGCH